MDKDFILDEIRRTAALNNGTPLGRNRFEQETGIRPYDVGNYWARWGDAILEAGFEPNTLNATYSHDAVIGTLTAIARELGRIPTQHELRLRRSTDRAIPDEAVFRRIGRTKRDLVRSLVSYCERHPDFEDVVAICDQYEGTLKPAAEAATETPILGDVYLIKSGRYYKIGFSVSATRRTREFRIQLPDLPQRIHTIRTDDPRGVEGYWHKRFEAKRVRPDAEFFKLDAPM